MRRLARAAGARSTTAAPALRRQSVIEGTSPESLTASAGPAAAAEATAVADERTTLQALVKRLAERQSRFVCSVCGFRAQRHYWQCPGCNRWDSYPAHRADDSDR